MSCRQATDRRLAILSGLSVPDTQAVGPRPQWSPPGAHNQQGRQMAFPQSRSDGPQALREPFSGKINTYFI